MSIRKICHDCKRNLPCNQNDLCFKCWDFRDKNKSLIIRRRWWDGELYFASLDRKPSRKLSRQVNKK